MSCPDELTLSIYADGELPEARARRVAAHLEGCASCRALVASLEQENAVLMEALGEEEAVDGAADAIYEESESEDAVYNGGNAGEVVYADAYESYDEAWFGILAEVDASDNAEWEGKDAHDEHEGDGTEDGGEESAFGIGFAGFVEE